jgi:translation initiation factor IF-1
VVELLPSGLYRVDLDGQKDIVVHPAGAAVMNAMRLRAGDRVEVALSPHDHHRGRITKLLRKT